MITYRGHSFGQDLPFTSSGSSCSSASVLSLGVANFISAGLVLCRPEISCIMMTQVQCTSGSGGPEHQTGVQGNEILALIFIYVPSHVATCLFKIFMCLPFS